jgi:hypothetical protein
MNIKIINNKKMCEKTRLHKTFCYCCDPTIKVFVVYYFKSVFQGHFNLKQTSLMLGTYMSSDQELNFSCILNKFTFDHILTQSF